MASEIASDKPVNRCECVGKTFTQLKAYGSIEKAAQATQAGTQCSGCLPYMKLMFATGETAFEIEDSRLEDELPSL